MAEQLPQIFAGRYEVGEPIGRGGMAEVYIGKDTRLGRTVAIKALRSDLLTDPTNRARFAREAQSAASLNHPSIVSVYDSGEETFTAADGTTQHIPYIIMEYVEGHTVRDLVRDGSAVPIDEALEITIGVLNALEYSHHSGIVHRDIKPGNVMLTPTGAIKVMDFGIARVLTDPSSAMTQTHAVVGTAQYLSPEQAKGEAVDARSDLYSTGVLLYELLTGQPPFTGDSAVAVAYQHVGEQAPLPSTIAPDLPESLDRITMKALAKNPHERYSSAAEFRSDLEAVMHSGIVNAPAVAASAAATQVLPGGSPFPPISQTTVLPTGETGVSSLSDLPEEEEEESRSRAWIWVVLVALLVLGGIGLYLFLNMEPPPEEPTEVAVPTLSEGMTEVEVRDALAEVNLEMDLQDPVHHPEIAENLLVKWDPDSGEMVEKGSAVKVWFSSGPESLTMIDIVDYKRDIAQNLLSDAGFDLRNVTWETENVPRKDKDLVTRTSPSAGDEVGPEEKITVYLASGLVDVPDTTTMLYEEALESIPDGIQVNVIYREIPVDEVAPGTVLSQNRSGLLAWDESITLEISQAAPEPEPEPEPEPDPEPEPEPDPEPDPDPETPPGEGEDPPPGEGG